MHPPREHEAAGAPVEDGAQHVDGGHHQGVDEPELCVGVGGVERHVGGAKCVRVCRRYKRMSIVM